MSVMHHVIDLLHHSYLKSYQLWCCLYIYDYFSKLSTTILYRRSHNNSLSSLHDLSGRPLTPPSSQQTLQLNVIPRNVSKEDLLTNRVNDLGKPDYIGLCVPIDVTMMFQVNKIIFVFLKITLQTCNYPYCCSLTMTCTTEAFLGTVKEMFASYRHRFDTILKKWHLGKCYFRFMLVKILAVNS